MCVCDLFTLMDVGGGGPPELSHPDISHSCEGVHEIAVLPALALISCPDSEPPLDHLPVFYVVALLLFLKVDMKR